MLVFTWFEENREAEVNCFEREIIIFIDQQKVFRLEISMHNPERMTGLNNSDNNFGQFCSLPLSVVTPLDDAIKQLTPRTKLHDNMNIEWILISALDGDNVLVTCQMVHYLNFPPNILHILLGNQLPLGDGFACIFNGGGILGA